MTRLHVPGTSCHYDIPIFQNTPGEKSPQMRIQAGLQARSDTVKTVAAVVPARTAASAAGHTSMPALPTG